MVELIPKERLQPSLLDRLTDYDPDRKQESRAQRILSIRRIREAVLRDLGWLFNATNLAAAQALDEFPLVSHSVVNYGLPELAGHTLSGADLDVLERNIRQAISDFEPRLLRNTLKIHAIVDKRDMTRNAVAFEIEGQLWAQPAAEHLLLKTQVDLESGDVTVLETV